MNNISIKFHVGMQKTETSLIKNRRASHNTKKIHKKHKVMKSKFHINNFNTYGRCSLCIFHHHMKKAISYQNTHALV